MAVPIWQAQYTTCNATQQLDWAYSVINQQQQQLEYQNAMLNTLHSQHYQHVQVCPGAPDPRLNVILSEIQVLKRHQYEQCASIQTQLNQQTADMRVLHAKMAAMAGAFHRGEPAMEEERANVAESGSVALEADQKEETPVKEFTKSTVNPVLANKPSNEKMGSIAVQSQESTMIISQLPNSDLSNVKPAITEVAIDSSAVLLNSVSKQCNSNCLPNEDKKMNDANKANVAKESNENKKTQSKSKPKHRKNSKSEQLQPDTAQQLPNFEPIEPGYWFQPVLDKVEIVRENVERDDEWTEVKNRKWEKKMKKANKKNLKASPNRTVVKQDDLKPLPQLHHLTEKDFPLLPVVAQPVPKPHSVKNQPDSSHKPSNEGEKDDAIDAHQANEVKVKNMKKKERGKRKSKSNVKSDQVQAGGQNKLNANGNDAKVERLDQPKNDPTEHASQDHIDTTIRELLNSIVQNVAQNAVPSTDNNKQPDSSRQQVKEKTTEKRGKKKFKTNKKSNKLDLAAKQNDEPKELDQLPACSSGHNNEKNDAHIELPTVNSQQQLSSDPDKELNSGDHHHKPNENIDRTLKVYSSSSFTLLAQPDTLPPPPTAAVEPAPPKPVQPLAPLPLSPFNELPADSQKLLSLQRYKGQLLIMLQAAKREEDTSPQTMALLQLYGIIAKLIKVPLADLYDAEAVLQLMEANGQLMISSEQQQMSSPELDEDDHALLAGCCIEATDLLLKDVYQPLLLQCKRSAVDIRLSYLSWLIEEMAKLKGDKAQCDKRLECCYQFVALKRMLKKIMGEEKLKEYLALFNAEVSGGKRSAATATSGQEKTKEAGGMLLSSKLNNRQRQVNRTELQWAIQTSGVVPEETAQGRATELEKIIFEKSVNRQDYLKRMKFQIESFQKMGRRRHQPLSIDQLVTAKAQERPESDDGATTSGSSANTSQQAEEETSFISQPPTSTTDTIFTTQTKNEMAMAVSVYEIKLQELQRFVRPVEQAIEANKGDDSEIISQLRHIHQVLVGKQKATLPKLFDFALFLEKLESNGYFLTSNEQETSC